MLLEVHLLQNLDLSKRRQQALLGLKRLTGVCAKAFDQKVIFVIGALDENLDRLRYQILKTLRNALSPSGDYVKVLICTQSGFRDNLGAVLVLELVIILARSDRARN